MKIPERMKVLSIEAPGRAAWKDAPVPVPAEGEVLVPTRRQLTLEGLLELNERKRDR